MQITSGCLDQARLYITYHKSFEAKNDMIRIFLVTSGVGTNYLSYLVFTLMWNPRADAHKCHVKHAPNYIFLVAIGLRKETP
jgi:hypothetical protein